MRIMGAQQLGREADHLGADDFKTGFLKTINHIAHVFLLQTIGFQDDEGG